MNIEEEKGDRLLFYLNVYSDEADLLGVEKSSLSPFFPNILSTYGKIDAGR